MITGWIYILIAAIFIVVDITLRKKFNRPYTHEIFECIRSVGVLELWKGLIFLVPNFYAINIFFMLFELTHLWVVGSFVKFSAALCFHKIGPVSSKVFVTLGVLDCVSFVVNLFTGHLYTIQMNGSVGEITMYPAFATHFIVLGIYMVYILFSVIRKMAEIYYLYWLRYAVCLAGAVFFCIEYFTMFRGDYLYKIEVSFPILAALSFLLVIVTRSIFTRSFEYAAALNSMSQIMVLYDNIGQCVLANDSAFEFFGLDESGLSQMDSIIKGMDVKPMDPKLPDSLQVCEYVQEGGVHYLRVEQRKLMRKNRFAGTILGLTDITNEMLELEEQKRVARFDEFTQIYDGHWLYRVIEEELNKNPGREYYIVGSDIRDFKVFNDVYGKEAGDEVILHIAEVLKRMHKEGQIIYFGRIYADRFGMLVDRDHYSEEAIIKELANIEHSFKEEYYHLNIHFGIYHTLMEPGVSVKGMFDRAYVALDVIKNEANIRAYHYNEIMRDEKIWEQTISGNIKKAIKEGQLRIVVQPQVDREERVLGGEALVRWRHPENGEISPGEFIPVLEKTGLVTTTDIHVWEESCKLLRRWKDLGHTDYYISVNISATDFIFADIYAIFTGLVQKYDIDPRNLNLEITETAMMTDVLERIVLIKRLEDYGFSVELDDFGSGYSSLNMLKEIPVDVIKMDMKFLYNYEDEATSNSRKIIGHMIQMAKDLDMEVVAEGVETVEQLDFLKSIGCDVFQGYYFSRPVEIDEFESRQGIV